MKNKEKEKENIIGENKDVLGGATVEISEKTSGEDSREDKKVYIGYVGFWKRVAAFVLDYTPGMILGIIWVIFNYTTYMENLNVVMAETLTNNDPFAIFGTLGASYWIVVGLSLAVIVYHMYLYFSKGQGIGYKVFGFKIIDQESGKKPSVWKLLKRWVIKWLPIFGLFLMSIPATFAGLIQTGKNDVFFLLGVIFMILVVIIMILIYIWPLVIGISVGVNKNKRGLHDRWTQSMVVSEKKIKPWVVWVINGGFVLVYILYVSYIMYATFSHIDYENDYGESASNYTHGRYDVKIDR